LVMFSTWMMMGTEPGWHQCYQIAGLASRLSSVTRPQIEELAIESLSRPAVVHAPQ